MDFTRLTPSEKAAISLKAFKSWLSKLNKADHAWVMTLPKQYQRLQAEVIAGTVSRTKQIKAKCQDCCGFEDLKNNIGHCPITRCGLWSSRPYQVKDDAIDEDC